MIKANIEKTYTGVLRGLPAQVERADVVFICTEERRNAEVVKFDKPTFFLNTRENAHMNVMLKFLATRYSSFLITRSEHLTIPDVKEILKILEGCKVMFTGVYDDIESKEEYLSSYYLDRNYERVGE